MDGLCHTSSPFGGLRLLAPAFNIADSGALWDNSPTASRWHCPVIEDLGVWQLILCPSVAENAFATSSFCQRPLELSNDARMETAH